MSKAFNPRRDTPKGKMVFAVRKLRIVPASEIWPTRTDTDGINVLVGEMYTHDDWHAFRSSSVVDINGTDHETLNSIYRTID